MKRLDIDKAELGNLLDAQLSYKQIAEHFGCSVSVIQRRMDEWNLRRRPKGLKYDEDAPKHIARECTIHGVVRHRLETSRGKRWYRCLKCGNEYGQKVRKSIKEALVEEFGGKCQICGYNRCLSVLQFHHKDPKQKIKSVSQFKTLVSAREEAQKCDLLCSNCHDEITYKPTG